MKYSLIAILLFSFTALQAQVKGTVKDNLGDPIAGANLFWQGTTQGTTTSADGTFSLSKPNDKHMLVVSFIGFENDTIHVSNRNETLDIVLREGVELSEVNEVVIPFFRQVLVIIVCALVGEEQRTPDIAFDGVLVGREREEKLMETLHVRFRFNRSVLCHIL